MVVWQLIEPRTADVDHQLVGVARHWDVVQMSSSSTYSSPKALATSWRRRQSVRTMRPVRRRSGGGA